MTNDHWFDTLNKVLIRDVPRRAMLGAAAATIAGIALGAVPGTAAAKNRKQGKGKGKGKGKKKVKPHPAPSCSGGACAAVPEWAGDQAEIAFCETKCERCRNRSKFCIVDYPAPTRATCCHENEECCGDECCAPPKKCCDRPRGRFCVPENIMCCPDEPVFGHCFRSEETCCPGVGCVDTETNSEHCGGCSRLCAVDEECVDGDCVCPDGLTRCGDECVDTNTDRNHCGEDCLLCAVDQQCVDGDCVFVDCPDGLTRCDGECVNTNTAQFHCGGCDRPCPRPSLPDFSEWTRCCGGLCYDPSQMTCCPNGITACGTDRLCVQSDSSAFGWGCAPR